MSQGEEASSLVQLKGLVRMNLEPLQMAQLSHHTEDSAKRRTKNYRSDPNW